MVTTADLNARVLLWGGIVSHPPSRAEAALGLATRALAKASEGRARDDASEALRSEFLDLVAVLRDIRDEIPVNYLGHWMRGGPARPPYVRLCAIDRFAEIISISARDLDLTTVRVWTARALEHARALETVERYMDTLPRAPRRRAWVEPQPAPRARDHQVSTLRWEVNELRNAHERVDQVWEEIEDLPSIRKRLSQARADLAKHRDLTAELSKLRGLASGQKSMAARISRLEHIADDPTASPNRGRE